MGLILLRKTIPDVKIKDMKVAVNYFLIHCFATSLIILLKKIVRGRILLSVQVQNDVVDVVYFKEH